MPVAVPGAPGRRPTRISWTHAALRLRDPRLGLESVDQPRGRAAKSHGFATSCPRSRHHEHASASRHVRARRRHRLRHTRIAPWTSPTAPQRHCDAQRSHPAPAAGYFEMWTERVASSTALQLYDGQHVSPASRMTRPPAAGVQDGYRRFTPPGSGSAASGSGVAVLRDHTWCCWFLAPLGEGPAEP